MHMRVDRRLGVMDIIWSPLGYMRPCRHVRIHHAGGVGALSSMLEAVLS